MADERLSVEDARRLVGVYGMDRDLERDWLSLVAQIESLAAQLQTAQTLLYRLEWAGEWADQCGICGCHDRKHKPDCELATFLRGPEGQR